MRRVLRKPEWVLWLCCTVAVGGPATPASAFQSRQLEAAPPRAPVSGLSGAVLDAESGAPMTQAIVSVGGASVETDADGRFVLPVEPGRRS